MRTNFPACVIRACDVERQVSRSVLPPAVEQGLPCECVCDVPLDSACVLRLRR